jgi:RPA family protein
MPEQTKRQVAYKVQIKDLINGRYIKKEGWQPNLLITASGLEISRINLIGTIVTAPSMDLNFRTLLLDDGSGKVCLRSFDEKDIFADTNIGDIVLVIGRPREYNNEKYIIPEIVKRIDNKKWVKVRMLELEKSRKSIKEVGEESTKEEVIVESPPPTSESVTQRIHNLIRDLDPGQGADYDAVLENAHSDKAETIISNLLKEGEVFEISPGKLKILE